MPSNLLVLHPKDPNHTVDPDLLRERLQRLGLAGETIVFEGEEHLRPGERFLELITFLGCSPVVSLGEPGLTGEEFCHLQVGAPSSAPRLLSGTNLKPPRCRHCRQRVEAWEALHRSALKNPTVAWRCPACDKASPALALDWRRCAGAARQFLTIWGVFESEAVPGDELLGALEQTGGAPWDYFYLRL
jgi:hypothetical protein